MVSVIVPALLFTGLAVTTGDGTIARADHTRCSAISSCSR
jgi:hypothetical protein